MDARDGELMRRLGGVGTEIMKGSLDSESRERIRREIQTFYAYDVFYYTSLTRETQRPSPHMILCIPGQCRR